MDEDHELFHACDPECTSCHDIDGSYECHCKPGFESTDGSTDTYRRICTDIVNCGFDEFCEDARTNCIDTPGSYRCERAVYGSALSDGGLTYDSVNECADPNSCDHDCFNDHLTIEAPTKFTCSCRAVIISILMTTSLVMTMKNVPLDVPTL